MRYPITHGTTATNGLMPRVWLTDADDQTVAHVVGRTASEALANARELALAYNRSMLDSGILVRQQP